MTATKPALVSPQTELTSLLDGLEREPWAHDFFALMRRIECLRPDAPRIGRAQRPSQEPLRLGQLAEMDFAAAPIATFERRGAGPPRLGVRFFGLLGPQGPMPLHLTEYVRERRHQHADPTLARFLVVFHHRMLCLFYRAWAQAQPTVQMDRPDDDRYAAWLGATFGLGPGTSASDSIPDAAKRFQAGLLASRSRHPEGLVKVLRQYFGVAVALRSHVAQWLPLQLEDRSRLGFAANRSQRRGGAEGGAQLGRSANAGSKVFDRQFKFRLEIGPLSLARYEAFLPGGTAWTELCDWVRLLAGGDLLWDVQLGLKRAESPAPRLGSGVRLGLTTWMGRSAKTTPATVDPDYNDPSDSNHPGHPSHTGHTSHTGDHWELRLRPASSALMRHAAPSWSPR